MTRTRNCPGCIACPRLVPVVVTIGAHNDNHDSGGAALSDRLFQIGQYESGHFENARWSAVDGSSWRLA